MPRVSAKITDQGLKVTRCKSDPTIEGEVVPWPRVNVRSIDKYGLLFEFSTYTDKRSDRHIDHLSLHGRISKEEARQIIRRTSKAIKDGARNGTLELRADPLDKKKFWMCAGLGSLSPFPIMTIVGLIGGPPPSPGAPGLVLFSMNYFIGIAQMSLLLLIMFALLYYFGTRRLIRHVNTDFITFTKKNKNQTVTLARDEIALGVIGRFNRMKFKTDGGMRYSARAGGAICIEALLALGYLDESERDKVERAQKWRMRNLS